MSPDPSGGQDEPQLGSESRCAAWRTVLLVAVLGFLPVAGCLTAPLLHLDDDLQIIGNPFLNPARGWWEAFTDFHYHQYIPLTHLSYRLNATLFGLETAWAYRLVNWLLHAASAVVLLNTLRVLGVGRKGALFIACGWVLHPMACESVAWVAERSNVLAFFFGMLAFHQYVTRGESWRGSALSALFFGLALLSKPLALGWLPIFVVLEALGGPRRLSGATAEASVQAPRAALLRLLPLLILAAGMVLLGLSGYRETFRPPPGGSWFTALLTDFEIYARYVCNIVVPIRISAIYGIDPIVSPGDPRWWGWLGFWVLLAGGTLWLAASRRRALFGWLWFFGALGPACNLVSIGYPMQDRYVYLASIGLLLVLVEAAAGFCKRTGAPGKFFADRGWLGPALGSTCLICLGGLCLARSLQWRSDVELLQQAVAVQPRSAIANILCADALTSRSLELEAVNPSQAREMLQRAAEHYQRAFAQPDLCTFSPPVAKVRWGKCLLELGESDAVIALLDELLGSLPSQAREVRFGEMRQYLIRCPQCGLEHQLSFESAARGYLRLAHARLAKFMQAQSAPAVLRQELDLAALNIDQALQHDPRLIEACYVAACLFVTRERFAAPAEDSVATARTVCRLSNAGLAKLSSSPEVIAELRPPRPADRLKALGCLGMAQASFDLIAGPDSEYLGQTDIWARRALVFDPDFSEALWLLAHVQHVQARLAAERGDLESAKRFDENAASWLSRIKPEAPRYAQAQQALAVLSRAAKPAASPQPSGNGQVQVTP